MKNPGATIREAEFLVRDRALLAWVAVAFLLSAVAVWSGLAEVAEQRATLERLVEADKADREAVLAAQSDWGDAAYYGFHLTYDAPSAMAFAAMGQRDTAPWKHRVRMLALEGQIYDSDTVNPEFALVGRFDFAFLVAFLLPLLLIVVLHDLHAGERAAGRHELLSVTAGKPASLWRTRAGLRATAVAVAVLIPFLIGGVYAGAGTATLLFATLIVVVHVLFWTVISTWLASWQQAAPVLLTVMIGIWMLLAVLLPAGGRMAIDRWVPLPSGADISLTQREAVNDAWDLPKAATMEPFLARHPEWSGHARIDRPFEWKWYFAFQQVGDQKVESLAVAYQDGRLARDRLAARLALLSPPSLVERLFQSLARTDVRAVLAYEGMIRAFHAELRVFYYPKLFRNEPFDVAALDALPDFAQRHGAR
jgi:ABC-2 type transport system permease protein